MQDTITYSDGSVYEGDVFDGIVFGRGILRYSNGDVYEGDFKYDEPCGKGKLTLETGEVFTGDFSQGECVNVERKPRVQENSSQNREQRLCRNEMVERESIR